MLLSSVLYPEGGACEGSETSYISLANINGFISELHTRLFMGGGGGTASLKVYGTVHPSGSL